MALKNKTTRGHYEKYETLRKKLGFRFHADSTQAIIGRTAEEVKDAYNRDPHLNNIPLDMWDRWWVSTLVNKSGLSNGEGVCLGKHCMIYDVLEATPEFTD